MNCMYKEEASSLSRIMSHFENKRICMITAFRQTAKDGRTKLSFSDNLKRNSKLKYLLKKYAKEYKWGYIPITGSYQEKGQKNPDIEKSFLIIADKEDKKFNRKMIDLGKLFNQDSVLLKTPDGDAYYVSTNQKDDKIEGMKLGRFVPGIFGKYYSKLGKKPFLFRFSDPNYRFKNILGSKVKNISVKKPENNKLGYKGLGVKNIYKQGNQFLVRKHKKGKVFTDTFDTLDEAKRYLQSISKMVYRKYIK